MNKQIEIMKALVENGGPKEMWVPVYKGDWIEKRVTGVDLIATNPYTTDDGYSHADVSLTDPNKTYQPIPKEFTHDWAKWRAVNKEGELCEFSYKPGMVLGGWKSVTLANWLFISEGHDPTNWENSLEERKRQTRPMTPREFARFVGDNMGKYFYKEKGWGDSFWVSMPNISEHYKSTDWLYAENVEGELEWRELPEVEG